MALSIWDLLTAEDGKVTWGNGLMYYKGMHPSAHTYRLSPDVKCLSASCYFRLSTPKSLPDESYLLADDTCAVCQLL